MATYKAVVSSHHKRKDGSYNIKIRVTHNRVSRWIPTNLYCTQAELTRTLKLKDGTLIDSCNQLIKRMRRALSDIPPFVLESKDVDWVANRIKSKLAEENFHLDFFEYAEQYILRFSESTRRAYSCALNTLERFLGRRYIDINDITRGMLLEFMQFVEDEPRMYFRKSMGKLVPSSVPKIKDAAPSRHMMKLAHIFNSAKAKYNDEDEDKILIMKSPFDNIKLTFPPSSQAQRNLGVEVIQKILSSDAINDTERFALDLFIVSFGLMGANVADLYSAPPVLDGAWVYNRQKTRDRRADGALMKVYVPECIQASLKRLQVANTGERWLPLLQEYGKDKDRVTGRANKALRKWAERNGIETFTMYAARHSWASIARSKRCGIEKATIDECLCGKGDIPHTDIYAERDWDVINDANRIVLSLFRWEGVPPCPTCPTSGTHGTHGTVMMEEGLNAPVPETSNQSD